MSEPAASSRQPSIGLTHIATSVSDISIDDLLELAAELESELVAVGQGPRFARRLDAVLFEATGDRGKPGLNHYRDFGRLDALFAAPAQARDRTRLALLREYLNDDSVAPLTIRRLARRHPDNVDKVFRTLLRKPGFSWTRDGENLLRRRKKAFFEEDPTPNISTVSERLAELLR